MTTHTNSQAEQNRLTALRLIADGHPLNNIHASTLRALETKRLALRTPSGKWELLPGGRTLLNEALGVIFHLQMKHKDVWVPVLESGGKTASYLSLAEAEATAAACSIINSTAIRIVEGDDAEPGVYTVYDFGRRYIEHSAGGRSSVPLPPKLNTGELETEAPFNRFVVQRRSRHWATNGMFTPWVIAHPTRFVDQQDAVAAARSAAAKDTNAYEYRVTVEDMPDLPPVVYVQSQTEPDLGLLDLLAAYMVTEGETEKQRKAIAIGVMLAQWAISPDSVIDGCRASLQYASHLAELPIEALLQKLA